MLLYKPIIFGTAALASMFITMTHNAAAATMILASKLSSRCDDKGARCVKDLKDEKLDRGNINATCKHYTDKIIECVSAVCTSDDEKRMVKDKIRKRICDPCENRRVCSYDELEGEIKQNQVKEEKTVETISGQVRSSSSSSESLSAVGAVLLLAVLMAWDVFMY